MHNIIQALRLRAARHSPLRDALFTAAVLGAAFLLSFFLIRTVGENGQFAGAIFILAVTLISRFTRGYVYGIAASVLGVFFVNAAFTYPYWKFDLSIAGYPLTFSVMLAVSLFISALTTKLMRVEAIRAEAKAESMRANLLRSVSHDLRTPLTSIVGASSVLLENPDLPEAQKSELLTEINKDARWLTRLTENILSVTKLSGERVALHKEEDVVEEIVADAIVKFRKGHNAVPVIIERPEKILLAPMDATLIEQVLINLFENAVEHGGTTKKITVTISEEDECVSVTVSDDGQGIAPALLPHVFDLSVSTQGAQADSRRNMGIGLSVCRSILLSHGGDITAANRRGGGAAFTFRLPLEKGNESNERVEE